MRKSNLFLTVLVAFLVLINACSKEGPVGPAGENGATGEKGATGETGAVGPAGVDGSKIYSGQGSPSTELGVSGDYYLDLSTGIIYGPKTDEGWGTGFGLSGENGKDGSVIYSGTELPSVETSLPEGYNLGDYFLDTDDYLLYGPLHNGTTGYEWGPGLQLKGGDGNANVQTFKLTVTGSDWSYFQNASTYSYKYKYYRCEFPALSQDIIENGLVLVYMANTIDGYQILPITQYLPNLNMEVWSSATRKLTHSSTSYMLEIKYILQARVDLTQTIMENTTSSFKIIVIQGSTAQTLTTATKKLDINTLSQELGIDL